MYALDQTAARKADSTGNQINEIGKYVGKFMQAEDIVAKTGTKGIAINFESDGGQKARISLYTQKADGTRIMGFDSLMALMTCMGLRNIKPQPGVVKFWDNEQKKEAERHGSVFPELCTKSVGLLLETEEYEKQDGSLANRMVLAGVFQQGTELTASEILDRKTTPEHLEKMVARLHHRPLKGAKKPAQHSQQSSNDIPPDNYDESIPF